MTNKILDVTFPNILDTLKKAGWERSSHGQMQNDSSLLSNLSKHYK